MTGEAAVLDDVDAYERIIRLMRELRRARGSNIQRVGAELRAAVAEREALRDAAVQRREAELLQRIAELEEELARRPLGAGSATR